MTVQGKCLRFAGKKAISAWNEVVRSEDGASVANAQVLSVPAY